MLKRIGNILTAIALFFIVYKLVRLDINFSLYHDWPRLLVCVILGIIPAVTGIFLGSWAWQLFLEALSDTKLKYLEVFHIFSKANIGKYLPGNIMHFVERNLFAANHGLGQLETLTGTLMEIAGQLLASLLISAALASPEFYLFLSQSMTTGRVLVGGTLIIVGIVGLILFCRKNTKLREMLARICSFRFAKTFAFSTFLYFMAFAINCLTMLLALYAIRPFTSLSTLPLVFAMGTLAWLVGYVTPGAPGGIGIREVVLSTMAAHTEFGDIILVAAVGQRFMFIASDFVAYLLGNILYKAPSVTTEPTPKK